MKLRGFIKTYRFIKIIRKNKDERGTWRLVYPYGGMRYNLKFVANVKQAAGIIKGFIKSVENPRIIFHTMTEEKFEEFKKLIDDYTKKREWVILPK